MIDLIIEMVEATAEIDIEEDLEDIIEAQDQEVEVEIEEVEEDIMIEVCRGILYLEKVKE